MDNNFAYNLRWLRKANHMNQADIGKYVGKSQDLVSAWEKGTRKPLVEDVYILANLFGIGMEQLYFGDVTEVAVK